MELTNEKLKLQIQLIFNKKLENITNDDLLTLKTITINSKGLQPDEADKNIMEVFNSCPNLEEVTFAYTYITKKVNDIIKGKKLKKINLDNVAFEDEENIQFSQELRYIQMRHCYLDTYESLIKNLPDLLETFYITYPLDESTITVSSLNRLKGLKNLILDGCIVEFDKLELTECEYLSLLGTNINEEIVAKIATLPKLKKTYISSKYNELNEIKKLAEKVEIKNDLSEYTVMDEQIKMM